MKSQQIEKNIEQLKELCSGAFNDALLQYTARKYGDYDISKITDILFDPDQFLILEQEYKFESSRCESEIMTPFFKSLKHIDNQFSLDNLDSLPNLENLKETKYMRFSNFITSNRYNINRLLQCAQKYSIERGW